MKVLFTIFVLFLYNASFAQLKMADSIEKLIEEYKSVDTTLVNLRQSYVAKKMFLTPADPNWLDYNKETLAFATELNYTKGKLLANNNIGVVYHYLLSDPLTALEYYQVSYKITEKEPLLEHYQPAILSNIGLIHYEQENYDRALSVFKKLLKFPQKKSNTLSNIGNIYGHWQQTDSASYYYEASIVEAQLTGDNLQIANTRSNLGLIQAQAGMIDEGLLNISLSLHLIDSLSLEGIRIPTYINASEVYMYNNDLDKAEFYANESLNAVKSLNNLYTESKSLLTLASIQEKKGEYQKALKNFKAYSVLNDSLINTDRKIEISKKEIQYEADKKEALALIEAARQRAIKNATFLGGTSIIVASLFAFIVYRRKQGVETAKKEAEFNATVAEVELKALRAQMNPHFIFNSLNSIGDYILKNDSQSASDYLSKFAILMRMTLENSDKKEITLDKDIILLNNYLAIEKRRFQNTFDFEFKVDPHLDADEILIPPMLLQPFVENSIIHGLSKKKEGYIIVSFEAKNNQLVCTVEDNGVGRNVTKKYSNTIKKQSMGITITQNRIDILNKTRNSNGSIKFVDKEIGTKVIVTLPLKIL